MPMASLNAAGWVGGNPQCPARKTPKYAPAPIRIVVAAGCITWYARMDMFDASEVSVADIVDGLISDCEALQSPNLCGLWICGNFIGAFGFHHHLLIPGHWSDNPMASSPPGKNAKTPTRPSDGLGPVSRHNGSLKQNRRIAAIHSAEIEPVLPRGQQNKTNSTGPLPSCQLETASLSPETEPAQHPEPRA